MKRLIAAAIATGCLVSFTPVFAAGDDASVFDKWMNPGVSECVPVAAIQSVSRVTDLTAEQFQFVRAPKHRRLV